jgi:AcrR family transcriptional regulator
MAARRRSETMEENRGKLIAAGRKAFASEGFAASSMDELTIRRSDARRALSQFWR